MLLTPEQLYEIQKIISQHHSAFAVNTMGPNVVPQEVLEELKAKGLIKQSLNTIGESYTYGQLLGTLESEKIATMSYGEFKNHLRVNPIPLTESERGAMEMAAQSAGQYCRGLGNRAGVLTNGMLIDVDRQLRARMEADIRTATEENIAKRESVEQLKSDIGWATKDWARDLKRIAVTEKVTAMNQGVSDHYKKRYGADTLMAKRVMPDACFRAGTLIKTKRGEIPIEQVRLGDKVLTHKLRWKKVTHLFKNQYEGDLYGFNGNKPSATTNHPMLVDLDWSRADSIKIGSYMVEIGDVNVTQNDPTLVSKSNFFSNISSAGTSPSVPIPTVKLNSYLQMRDSNIDVKFIDSHFQNGFEVCKSLTQSDSILSSTTQSTLTSLGFSKLCFPGASFFSSISSTFRKVKSLIFGHTFEPCFLTLGSCWNGNIPFSQSPFDVTPRDSKVVSDGRNGVFTAFKHPVHNNVSSKIFDFFHKSKLTANVRRVNSIAKEHFKGVVYNLEVEDDNSYVANGFVVHNCSHCQRLYNGPNGPRVFKLSTLEANGTNVGRKANDWLAVIGSTHPNCQCVPIRVPPGWGWDEFGDMVPGGKIDMYESPEELALAMMQEDDLQKGFKLQGHVTYQGIPIAIENKEGSVRRWGDVNGEHGETKMVGVSYGYAQGTLGADEDEIDVFVGPDPRAGMVYVVHQQNPATGIYDEMKAFLGCSSVEQAKKLFMLHYDSSEFFGWIETFSVDSFKRLIYKTKPQIGEDLTSKDIKLFKSSTNSNSGNTVFGGDFLNRCAFFVEGNRFISWPEASRLIVSERSSSRQVSIFKSFIDSGLVSSQNSGYFPNTKSSIPECEGFVEIPGSGSPMLSTMFGCGHQLQIGGGIIKSIPVAVMDEFIGSEWAIQNRLHNNSMLKSLSSIFPDKPILCLGIREFTDMTTLKFATHKSYHTVTNHKNQELFKTQTGSEPVDSTKLVVLIPEKLEKAAARGGKYIKRVPYYKDGKKKYRYYYAESAVARDVKEGETIKLGKKFAKVESIDKDGTIHLDIDGKSLKVAANQWDTLLTRHYGSAYLNWAEKRAQQSVNAVLKRVPKAELEDLKGTTDKERLAELKERVPKVYGRLEKSFHRAGVNPFRAKQLLTNSLERRGWEPEARAAVIGDVITKRNKNYQTTIRAAENIAGGGTVEVGHVAAVTEIVQKIQNPKKDEIASIAEQAEKELATLSSLIAKARAGGSEESANALAAALSSQAIQKLNLISKAFPGVADRTVEPAREVMLEVPSIAPRTQPTDIGSSTDVFVAGEGGKPQALNARYKLMEANDAIASHDPKNFNRRKDYPEGVQERAYHRDQDEQAKVIRNAQQMRPEFVVNTNPDAVNGAPIMGPDGVVLGGNSRTMSVQRAYVSHPEKGEEFKKYLRDNAHQVGFTKEDVDAFKNPILVRVLDKGGESLEHKQLLVRQMNESFTQSMDPRTEQVAWGRKLTDEAVKELGNAMDPDETLSEFLGSPRAQGFIAMLERTGIIDQRTANRYFDKKAKTKTLNVDGKALVSGVLVGRMVKDADLLSTTKTSIVDSVAKTVPYIEQAKEYGSGYDLSDDFRVALDAYNYLQRIPEKRKSMKPDMPKDKFDLLFSQMMLGDVIREAHPVQDNPKAMNLLEILIRRSGAKQIVGVFKDYAASASHNVEGEGSDAGLLGDKKTPTQILEEITRKHADKAFKDAAAKKKKKEPEPEQTGLFGKSAKPIRTPIPHKKVEKGLSPEEGAANSRAGNRGPGPGLGINYVIPLPEKKNQGKKDKGYFPAREELFDELFEEEQGALHIDKDEYDFSEPERKVLPIEVDPYIEANKDAREGTEERGRYVKRQPILNAHRPKNKVERTPVKKDK